MELLSYHFELAKYNETIGTPLHTALREIQVRKKEDTSAGI
jgi:hypothetical protein